MWMTKPQKEDNWSYIFKKIWVETDPISKQWEVLNQSKNGPLCRFSEKRVYDSGVLTASYTKSWATIEKKSSFKLFSKDDDEIRAWNMTRRIIPLRQFPNEGLSRHCQDPITIFGRSGDDFLRNVSRKIKQ